MASAVSREKLHPDTAPYLERLKADHEMGLSTREEFLVVASLALYGDGSAEARALADPLYEEWQRDYAEKPFDPFADPFADD